MMKYVFVLALLHLCVSVESNTNLNNEIIKNLNELKKKVSSRTDADVKAPARETLRIPQECLGEIIKELGNLLNNTIVQKKDEHYILKLKGNLSALGGHKENVECQMTSCRNPRKALQGYSNFFKKLNSKA